MIGRVHILHQLSGDELCLRILIHHDHCHTGVTSFKDLLTVDNVMHESFKAV